MIINNILVERMFDIVKDKEVVSDEFCGNIIYEIIYIDDFMYIKWYKKQGPCYSAYSLLEDKDYQDFCKDKIKFLIDDMI